MQQPGLRCIQTGHFTNNPDLLINVEENDTEAPSHDALEKLAALLTLSDRLRVKRIEQDNAVSDITELEIATVVEEATTTEEQIEKEWDTSMMAEYGEEIFEYMRQLEVSSLGCQPNAWNFN